MPISFMGYKLFNGNLSTLPDSSKTIINTINQYSFCLAERDKRFKEALMASDVLLPDGVGIVIGAKSSSGYRLKKISGTDLHQNMLARLCENKGRVFYLGSCTSTLAKIRRRVKAEYPGITCRTYSPPYKTTFTEADDEAMIAAINAFKPDVLFVGMTAPKQEKWVNQHKNSIDAKFICSIGAVFDFFAGTVQRPSQFWIDLGLEWFVRLCREPRRMWKRYIYYGPIFAYALLKEKVVGSMQQQRSMVYIEGDKEAEPLTDVVSF